MEGSGGIPLAKGSWAVSFHVRAVSTAQLGPRWQSGNHAFAMVAAAPSGQGGIHAFAIVPRGSRAFIEVCLRAESGRVGPSRAGSGRLGWTRRARPGSTTMAAMATRCFWAGSAQLGAALAAEGGAAVGGKSAAGPRLDTRIPSSAHPQRGGVAVGPGRDEALDMRQAASTPGGGRPLTRKP